MFVIILIFVLNFGFGFVLLRFCFCFEDCFEVLGVCVFVCLFMYFCFVFFFGYRRNLCFICFLIFGEVNFIDIFVVVGYYILCFVWN